MSKKFGTNFLISELLFPRRPSAIAGSIIAISIDAINRVIFGGLFAHIRQECFKTIGPTITHFNATRSIQWIRNVSSVLAAINHTPPRVIFRRSFSISANRDGSSVCSVGFFSCLDLVATAAKSIPGSEVWNRNGLFLSAITITKHTAYRSAAILSDFWIGFGNYGEFPKSHSDAVYGGSH